MDHLYNNPDMSDLIISATDQTWSWGQTQQDFIVKYFCQIFFKDLSSSRDTSVFSAPLVQSSIKCSSPKRMVQKFHNVSVSQNLDLEEKTVNWRLLTFLQQLWRVSWSIVTKTSSTKMILRMATLGTYCGDSGRLRSSCR